jgi:hypothetical protein
LVPCKEMVNIIWEFLEMEVQPNQT